MVDFSYQEMFPLGEDTTRYRLLSQDHVLTTSFEGKEILKKKGVKSTFDASHTVF